ncbi:MAG: PKD domain-containing protein, partial [Candidatus Diapherotrites archaeon]
GIVGKTSFEMNASASYDPDGTIVDYNWAFGDGNTTAGGEATHKRVFYTYYSSVAGSQTFTVTLTVRDNSGNVSQTSRDVNVKNSPPKATFSAVPLQGVKPLTVIFKATANDDDGHDVECEWNFGDDTSASGCESIHTYYNAGSYIPRLTVRDEFGAESSYNLDIFVYMVKAATNLTVRNTKVGEDTIATVYCTEGVNQNVDFIIVYPDGNERGIIGGVPCSLNGETTILLGNNFTISGTYMAKVVIPDCEGIECSKTTSFNVYEEVEVETFEMNIFAVVAVSLVALLITKLEVRTSGKR